MIAWKCLIFYLFSTIQSVHLNDNNDKKNIIKDEKKEFNNNASNISNVNSNVNKNENVNENMNENENASNANKNDSIEGNVLMMNPQPLKDEKLPSSNSPSPFKSGNSSNNEKEEAQAIMSPIATGFDASEFIDLGWFSFIFDTKEKLASVAPISFYSEGPIYLTIVGCKCHKDKYSVMDNGKLIEMDTSLCISPSNAECSVRNRMSVVTANTSTCQVDGKNCMGIAYLTGGHHNISMQIEPDKRAPSMGTAFMRLDQICVKMNGNSGKAENIKCCTEKMTCSNNFISIGLKK